MTSRCSRFCGAQRSAVILCLGLLMAVTEARAQSTKDVIDAVCSNWSDEQCLARFADHLDRELDAIWSRVLASIDASTAHGPDWKSKLAESQEYWVRFRRADCHAVRYEWHGGTGMSAAVSTCLAKHTLGRIQNLKRRYPDLFK